MVIKFIKSIIKLKPKIKAIIFDLNDVVIVDAHWHSVTNAAIKKNEDRTNLHDRINTKINYRDIWWKFMTGRITEKEYWTNIDKKLKNLSVLSAMKKDVYSLSIPKKGTLEIIRKLKEKYEIALLTNHSKEWMNLFRSTKDGTEIIKLFNPVILSADLGIKKPDFKIYEVTLSRLKVKPEEVLFIDNQEKNLKPARKLGINSILFSSALKLKKDLSEIGINV